MQLCLSRTLVCKSFQRSLWRYCDCDCEAVPVTESLPALQKHVEPLRLEHQAEERPGTTTAIRAGSCSRTLCAGSRPGVSRLDDVAGGSGTSKSKAPLTSKREEDEQQNNNTAKRGRAPATGVRGRRQPHEHEAVEGSDEQRRGTLRSPKQLRSPSQQPEPPHQQHHHLPDTDSSPTVNTSPSSKPMVRAGATTSCPMPGPGQGRSRCAAPIRPQPPLPPTSQGARRELLGGAARRRRAGGGPAHTPDRQARQTAARITKQTHRPAAHQAQPKCAGRRQSLTGTGHRQPPPTGHAHHHDPTSGAKCPGPSACRGGAVETSARPR